MAFILQAIPSKKLLVLLCASLTSSLIMLDTNIVAVSLPVSRATSTRVSAASSG